MTDIVTPSKFAGPPTVRSLECNVLKVVSISVHGDLLDTGDEIAVRGVTESMRREEGLVLVKIAGIQQDRLHPARPFAGPQARFEPSGSTPQDPSHAVVIAVLRARH
jgi:hypothetical protein